jgi:hypothetical protein
MAAPTTAPSNFASQQGNGQILLTWSLVSGATSYTVQRSTDQINYSTVSSPTATQYLDAAPTLGIQYWYKVAATNGDGTGPYTVAQSQIATNQGEMSLMELRLRCKQRADRVNSNFVSNTEWDSYINQSQYELYDLLITVYEDYYKAPTAQFTTVGNQYIYPLPDGITSFTNAAGSSFVPEAMYKLLGVDLAVNTVNNAWVTVHKYNFIDRNKYLYANSNASIYGYTGLRYRVMGNNIEFVPPPSGGQPIRLQYIPKLRMLLQDTDITSTSISGWIEYVIVDAAIKALQKEESDVSTLLAQKMVLKARIEEAASNRDAGLPDTISDTRGTNGGWGGWGGNGSGYGHGGW